MEYMSVEEAAEKWGLSEVHVRRLIASKRIKATRIGQRVWAIDKNHENPKGK